MPATTVVLMSCYSASPPLRLSLGSCLTKVDIFHSPSIQPSEACCGFFVSLFCPRDYLTSETNFYFHPHSAMISLAGALYGLLVYGLLPFEFKLMASFLSAGLLAYAITRDLSNKHGLVCHFIFCASFTAV